jgi:hypothetical protein
MNKEKIAKLFESRSEWTVSEIVNEISISKQMTHLILNKMMEEGSIVKLGRTPKTVYKLQEKNSKKANSVYFISQEDELFLQKKFNVVNEIGNIITGSAAFKIWCDKRKLPFEKTLLEYKSTHQKYEKYYNEDSIINGYDKIKNTKGYENIYLDYLYYLDFYAIERFGKTKLGNLLHYAKQGQNKMLMQMLVDKIKEPIHQLIKRLKVDAVAFVPPTIRREVQLMKVLQQKLKIDIPNIEIKKINGLIPIPQKSLNKLEDRIENANNTFLISSNKAYKHILLIDDAVGSGATLNQIALKIKNKKLTSKITGLAIVGSFNGFDVITDV